MLEYLINVSSEVKLVYNSYKELSKI